MPGSLGWPDKIPRKRWSPAASEQLTLNEDSHGEPQPMIDRGQPITDSRHAKCIFHSRAHHSVQPESASWRPASRCFFYGRAQCSAIATMFANISASTAGLSAKVLYNLKRWQRDLSLCTRLQTRALDLLLGGVHYYPDARNRRIYEILQRYAAPRMHSFYAPCSVFPSHTILSNTQVGRIWNSVGNWDDTPMRRGLEARFK